MKKISSSCFIAGKLLFAAAIFSGIFAANVSASEKFCADVEAPSALTKPVLRTKNIPAKYLPRYRNWQGIPAIERTKGGRLWAAWYAGLVQEGREGNFIVLYTSSDDGESWSGPVAVFDGTLFCNGTSWDPRLFKNSKGELFFCITRTMIPTREKQSVTSWVFKAENPENPLTKWSSANFLGYGVSLNKPTPTKDDRLLFPLDTRKPAKGQASRVAWVESDDDARTFRFLSSANIDENPDNTPLCEHQAVERSDGSLLMFIRVKWGIAQAESFDGGKTWVNYKPFTKDFCVNTRFAFVKLSSGNLLLVANDDPKTRNNMTAFLSKDEGKTWPYKISIDPRTSVSYPDCTQAPDGSIYIVYDRGRYAPEQQDILMAKITEKDIVAGKIVSKGSKLRVMINTLTNSGGGARAQYEYTPLEKAYKEQISRLKTEK